MTVRVVTAPAYYPVSRSEAKTWCRIDSDITNQDAVVDLLIAAATARAELITGRAFIQRDLQLILPWLPAQRIELPHPPLASVASITYIDNDGSEQTLGTDLYDVHTWREPGFVERGYLDTWPSTRCVPDAVRVNYTAGYAPVGSPTDEAAHQAGQPQQLKAWLHAVISTLYEQREQVITGTLVQIPRQFADGLLDDLVIGGRLA